MYNGISMKKVILFIIFVFLTCFLIYWYFYRPEYNKPLDLAIDTLHGRVICPAKELIFSTYLKCDLTYRVKQEFKLTSDSFSDGNIIPYKYTCRQGGIVFPNLKISGVPRETRSLVLVIANFDAPENPFISYILYNLSPRLREIEEGGAPGFGTTGDTSFGFSLYEGICGSKGTSSRHTIIIYALNKNLNLEEGLNYYNLIPKIKDYVIDEAKITAVVY